MNKIILGNKHLFCVAAILFAATGALQEDVRYLNLSLSFVFCAVYLFRLRQGKD